MPIKRYPSYLEENPTRMGTFCFFKHDIFKILLIWIPMGMFFSCTYSFTYVKDKHIKDCTPEEIIETAREAFYFKDYEEAIHLAAFIIESFPDSSDAEEAIYIAGESCFQSKEYFESFRYFKELLARFPSSQYLGTIADRDYEIGDALLNPKPGFFGHLFTERSRGIIVMKYLVTQFSRSEFADDAQMAIGDFYFENEEYVDAYFAYERLIQDYPGSEWIEKAYFRLGLSYLRKSKEGESYDRGGLLKALSTMRTYLKLYPNGGYAKEAALEFAKLQERLAQKELMIALFYLEQGRDIGARIHLANIMILFPKTIAGEKADEIMKMNQWDLTLNSVDRYRLQEKTPGGNKF